MAALEEKILGKRLQKVRRQHGLTQQKLCQKANISYSTLAKIERGAIKAPSIFTVQNLAAAIGVSLDELMGELGSSSHKAPEWRTKSGVRFVYFDLNDTLVRATERVFTTLAEQTGLPSDVIETLFWHYNDALCHGRMSIDQLNDKLSERLGAKVDWREAYLASAEAIKPMQELLSWASQYYPVGICSNTLPGLLDGLRAKSLLPNIEYQAIIDSSEVGAVKPEPALYKAAQLRAGVAADEILLIDDTRASLQGAERQGWHVAIFDGYRPEESVKRLKDALQPVSS